MKCKYCGGPLSIEDEYCPHCGALNQEARQHIEDMRRYNRAFHRTRSRVMDETGRQSRRHGQILVLVLLVVFNVTLLAGHRAIYDLEYWWSSVQASLHAKEYAEKLFELEAGGNYRELKDYYDNNNLYMADELREFYAVDNGARHYAAVYECIMWLSDPFVEEIYYTEGELVERLAENVVWFYEELSREENGYHPEQFAGSHKEALIDMEAGIRAMLETYCGMTKQDLERLSQISSQELMLLIGRRIGFYD